MWCLESAVVSSDAPVSMAVAPALLSAVTLRRLLPTKLLTCSAPASSTAPPTMSAIASNMRPTNAPTGRCRRQHGYQLQSLACPSSPRSDVPDALTRLEEGTQTASKVLEGRHHPCLIHHGHYCYPYEQQDKQEPVRQHALMCWSCLCGRQRAKSATSFATSFVLWH